MLEWIKENSVAFIVALTLHLVFLAALLINWEFDKPEQIVLKQGDIIQTTAVDANAFDAEVRKIEQQKQAEQRRKAEAQRKARELKEQQRLEKLRRQKEKQRKAEELKRKRAAEAKKKEEQRKAALLKEKQRKEQELKEQQRREAEKKAAKEKRQREEAKRKEEARKKAELEKRRRAEEKKRQEAERKRKAEEEQKRQAELKREQERQRAQQERLSKGIVNRHVALIAQKIERNWRQPLDAPRDLQCKIDIVLSSTGHVRSVKVVESSGSASFDRSVETAVRKASPLPVPTDSVIFKKFEVMRLRFEPGSH